MDSCKKKCRWSDLSFCLFWVFCSGLIAHGFAYFNAAFSHDGLYQLSGTDDLFQVSLGRFLQPVWRFVRGGISAPWLTGALSLLFIALAAHLVIHLLRLRRPLWRGLACALMAVNQTVTLLNATYTQCVDVFMLSLLLSVLAVWLLERGGLPFFALGTLSLTASLALYQSYVSVTLGLMLLLFIDRALQGREAYPPRALFAWACKAAAMALLGAALYWGGMKLSLRLAGISLSQEYNSIAGALDFSLPQLPLLVGRTYWRFIRLLAIPDAAQPLRAVLMNGLLAALCAGLFVYRAHRARPGKLNALLAAIAVALLPFALNISFFFSKGVQHRLMIYALALVYLMAMQFEERAGSAAGKTEGRGGKAVRCVIAAALSVLLFSNTIYANTVYLKKTLEAESFDMLMTRVLDRVEQVEGYVPGETPVAFLGNFYESPLLGEDIFAAYRQTGLEMRTPVTYGDVTASYLHDRLGYNIRLATDEETGAHVSDPEVQSLGVFPAADSVKMVDGCVYVRVSARGD